MDVAGKDFGTYDLEVQVEVPGNVQLVNLDHEKIKVEIKKAEDEPVNSTPGSGDSPPEQGKNE